MSSQVACMLDEACSLAFANLGNIILDKEMCPSEQTCIDTYRPLTEDGTILMMYDAVTSCYLDLDCPFTSTAGTATTTTLPSAHSTNLTDVMDVLATLLSNLTGTKET